MTTELRTNEQIIDHLKRQRDGLGKVLKGNDMHFTLLSDYEKSIALIEALSNLTVELKEINISLVGIETSLYRISNDVQASLNKR
jgi:hypothetical protein